MTRTVGVVVRDPGADAPVEESEFAGSVGELAQVTSR